MTSSATTLRGVLALLLAVLASVGPTALARGAAACSRCAARHCPAPSPRLACHSSPEETPCHRSGPRWSSAACRQAVDSLPPARDLALLGAPLAAAPPAPAVALRLPMPAIPIARSPEPPTDPPRGFVAA